MTAITETTELEPQDEGVEQDHTPDDGVSQADPIDEQGPKDAGTPDEDAETFPREYVVKLRQEAADARVKAKRADDLATRLHGALVAATGRLADPTDLPFDEAHLDDPDALTAALDDLLARKPHLASRRVTGNVGQGVSGSTDTVSLAGILRAGAN